MIVGNVYVVWASISRPPKEKIVLCISAGDGFFFWINTKPQHHGSGQFALRSSDHGALTRDCFLDCSRVTAFSANDIKSAHDRGPLSADLARRIVRFLIEKPPKTLPRRQLQTAIDNLSSLFAQS